MTSLGYKDLTAGGFDPDKDMLQVYSGSSMPKGYRGWGVGPNGGMVPDWDLKSNLDGLYGGGRFIFGVEDCAAAAATGRYAGRKAAEYALAVAPLDIDRKQVAAEKRRVYAPVEREEGIDWKELNVGICRIMQDYCGDWKSKELLDLGLQWFRELRVAEAQDVHARNPHELIKVLQTLNMIDIGEAIIHACLAREASSVWLGFERIDYPDMDPAQWHKWITVKLDAGRVVTGEMPIEYWGELEQNYQQHCGLGEGE
jgi:succinate dehydrogenase/fumarate reductase flavoprotein subunit